MSDSKNATVQVLLSTFNGETYLGALFESLLGQDYPDLQVLVRDDGSTDGTLDLLGNWLRKPGVRCFPEEHRGFVGSFFRLLEMASEEAGFFAFCDQDDVWLRDKISRAVDLLKRGTSQDQPAMYCGRPRLTDENLMPIGLKALPKRGPSFANALVQNIAAGCTIVLNSTARRLLVDRMPRQVPSHDWWCYLVMAGLGRVIYDPKPKVLYRQHDRNVIGHKIRFRDKLRKRLAGGGLSRGTCTAQAEEFRRRFGDLLNEENSMLLRRFTEPKSLAGRLGFALSGAVHGQSIKDDLKIKTLIALGFL